MDKMHLIWIVPLCIIIGTFTPRSTINEIDLGGTIYKPINYSGNYSWFNLSDIYFGRQCNIMDVLANTNGSVPINLNVSMQFTPEVEFQLKELMEINKEAATKLIEMPPECCYPLNCELAKYNPENCVCEYMVYCYTNDTIRQTYNFTIFNRTDTIIVYGDREVLDYLTLTRRR